MLFLRVKEPVSDETFMKDEKRPCGMKKKEICIINSELRNDRFTCHIIFLLRILRYLTVTSLVFSPILAVFQASEGTWVREWFSKGRTHNSGTGAVFRSLSIPSCPTWVFRALSVWVHLGRGTSACCPALITQEWTIIKLSKYDWFKFHFGLLVGCRENNLENGPWWDI